HPLRPVETVFPGRKLERPIVPRAAHHRAAVRERAVAERSALVHAFVGERVDLAVGAEHSDRARAGPESAALAFGKLLDPAQQIFQHRRHPRSKPRRQYRRRRLQLTNTGRKFWATLVGPAKPCANVQSFDGPKTSSLS